MLFAKETSCLHAYGASAVIICSNLGGLLCGTSSEGGVVAAGANPVEAQAKITVISVRPSSNRNAKAHHPAGIHQFVAVNQSPLPGLEKS